MNKKIKGWCFALAVALGLAGAPFPSLHAQAYDSNRRLDTASKVSAAVSSMNSGDAAEVDYIVAEMRALSPGEKKRLNTSTIRRLDNAHVSLYGYDQSISIMEGSVTTNRIPKTGASLTGATIAANGRAHISLVQNKPSSSNVLLQFTTDSSAYLQTPVIYTLPRTANVRATGDYYIRDADGNRLALTVTSSYMSFLATRPLGTFKIYKESQSGTSGGGGSVDSFWDGVISRVEEARAGDRLQANIGTRTTVPADLLRVMRGRTVTVTLRTSSGNDVMLYGRDLPTIPASKTYYTLSSLRQLYVTGSTSSRVSSSSSSSALPPPALPPAIPASSAYQPPVYQPPVYQPPVAIAPASSAASLQDVPDVTDEISEPEEDLIPDVEREATEDSQPESDSSESTPESSSAPPEEQTVAPAVSGGSFVLFVVLCIVVSASGAGLLAVAFYSRRSKK